MNVDNMALIMKHLLIKTAGKSIDNLMFARPAPDSHEPPLA